MLGSYRQWCWCLDSIDSFFSFLCTTSFTSSVHCHPIDSLELIEFGANFLALPLLSLPWLWLIIVQLWENCLTLTDATGVRTDCTHHTHRLLWPGVCPFGAIDTAARIDLNLPVYLPCLSCSLQEVSVLPSFLQFNMHSTAGVPSSFYSLRRQLVLHFPLCPLQIHHP